MNPEDEFLCAIEVAGMGAPKTIVADGKLHRFSPTGKRSDDAGWYVLHLDGVPAGAFGDWRTGESGTWCAKRDNELTDAERKSLRARIKRDEMAREAETLRRQAEAAKTAVSMWEAATPAIAHPYLRAKAVKAHGLRVHGALLLVPLRDVDGTLRSLQTISPSGEKRFLPGGKVKGCYHSIGRAGDRILVCEGYATGATLHQASGYGVAVAFNACNLEPVANALRAKYFRVDLVIAADDDWKTAGNPGMTAARQAARRAGARLVVPSFDGLPRGDKDTDFNDAARLRGMHTPTREAIA